MGFGRHAGRGSRLRLAIHPVPDGIGARATACRAVSMGGRIRGDGTRGGRRSRDRRTGVHPDRPSRGSRAWPASASFRIRRSPGCGARRERPRPGSWSIGTGRSGSARPTRNADSSSNSAPRRRAGPGSTVRMDTRRSQRAAPPASTTATRGSPWRAPSASAGQRCGLPAPPGWTGSSDRAGSRPIRPGGTGSA